MCGRRRGRRGARRQARGPRCRGYEARAAPKGVSDARAAPVVGMSCRRPPPSAAASPRPRACTSGVGARTDGLPSLGACALHAAARVPSRGDTADHGIRADEPSAMGTARTFLPASPLTSAHDASDVGNWWTAFFLGKAPSVSKDEGAEENNDDPIIKLIQSMQNVAWMELELGVKTAASEDLFNVVSEALYREPIIATERAQRLVEKLQDMEKKTVKQQQLSARRLLASQSGDNEMRKAVSTAISLRIIRLVKDVLDTLVKERRAGDDRNKTAVALLLATEHANSAAESLQDAHAVVAESATVYEDAMQKQSKAAAKKESTQKAVAQLQEKQESTVRALQAAQQSSLQAWRSFTAEAKNLNGDILPETVFDTVKRAKTKERLIQKLYLYKASLSSSGVGNVRDAAAGKEERNDPSQVRGLTEGETEDYAEWGEAGPKDFEKEPRLQGWVAAALAQARAQKELQDN